MVPGVSTNGKEMIALFLTAHLRSLTETESRSSTYLSLLKNPLGDGQNRPVRKTANQKLPNVLRGEEDSLFSPEESHSQTDDIRQTDNINPDNDPRLHSLKR